MAKVQKNGNPKKRNLKEMNDEDEQEHSQNSQSQEPKTKKQKCEEHKKEKNEENEKETLTKHDFMNHAENIEVECLNEKVILKPRCNDTGSVGWHGTKRCEINIENKRLDSIFNFHITVCKSGEWEAGTDDTEQNGKKKHAKSSDDENEEEHENEHKHNGKHKPYDSWNQDEFMKKAKEIQLQLLTYNVTLKPKINSTNTVGWHSSKKIQITVDDTPLHAMINFNITIYKSAQWPKNNSKQNDDDHQNKNDNVDENANDDENDNDIDKDKDNDNENENDNENRNENANDDENGIKNEDENENSKKNFEEDDSQSENDEE